MTTYKIVKSDYNGNEKNYGGGYSKEDVKLVTRGYTYNGLFYDRKNSKYFFIVEEENK